MFSHEFSFKIYWKKTQNLENVSFMVELTTRRWQLWSVTNHVMPRVNRLWNIVLKCLVCKSLNVTEFCPNTIFSIFIWHDSSSSSMIMFYWLSNRPFNRRWQETTRCDLSFFVKCWESRCRKMADQIGVLLGPKAQTRVNNFHIPEVKMKWINSSKPGKESAAYVT